MNGMSCTTSQQGNELVLKLQGQFTHAEMSQFDAQLSDIVKRKPSLVVVDMAELTMLTSAGIGALLKLQQSARAFNCDLRLAALQRNIEMVIRAARLDSVFTILPTLSEAVH